MRLKAPICLVLAWHRGNLSVVQMARLLLEHGAAMGLRDDHDHTALDHAMLQGDTVSQS